MKIYRASMAKCIIILGVLLLPLLMTSPVAAMTQSNEPDIAKIDAFLRTQMQANHLPGLAYALVHGKQIVQLCGYGIADPTGKPVTPQTPFIVGSVSKSITGLAIMQLVEAHKIVLDDPVQRYLPWFKTSDQEAASRITVRQLLNQTSGLKDDPNGFAGFSDEQELQRYMHSQIVVDRPVGSSFEYTSINYVLLGQIIQVVSGQSYADYVQQHIYKPLEMRHSYADVEQAKKAGLAQGYLWRFGIPLPGPDALLDIPTDVPATATAASAEDIAHYLIANMNEGEYQGRSVLSPAGILSMHTPPKLAHATPYGMGWGVLTVSGVTAIAHNGATYTFGAFMLIVPEKQWGAIILTNANMNVVEADLLPPMIQLLAGQEPTLATTSVGTFYLICDVVLAIAAFFTLLLLVRLPWWHRRLKLKPSLHWWQIVGPWIWECLLPALILVSIPTLLETSWPSLLYQVPELGWSAILIFSLWADLGLLRLALRLLPLMRKRRQQFTGA